MSKTCQMTMGDTRDWCSPGRSNTYPCGKPAKAWIPDALGRSGWGGRQYLCGVHARAHDRIAQRVGRVLAQYLLEESSEK